MRRFSELNCRTLAEHIAQEKILFALLDSNTSRSFTFDDNLDEKLSYFTKNLDYLKDALKCYLIFLKVIHSSEYDVNYNTSAFELFHDHLVDTFNWKSGSPDDYVEGITSYEFFEDMNLIPFNVYTDTISDLNSALYMLDIYGEKTLPNEVLNFLKYNVTLDNYEDENMDLFSEFETTISDWDFMPLSIPDYKFIKNSLSDEQVDFFLQHNNSYLYHWYTCHIESTKISNFLKKNINSQEVLNELFTLLRNILRASASNLATISNFTIIKVREEYRLECLIYAHGLELPDLIYLNSFDFKYLASDIISLNQLLNS